VLALVADIREDLPRLGTSKLHFLLQPRLGEHAPRVGRDYLFDLLAGHGLLIRRRKRGVVTTHTCLPLFRRPNLIEHLTVHRAEQVWVSDITYMRLLSGWSYLSLITDLYSHKIVGACLYPDLSVRGTLAALQQALAARTQPQWPLIHHSDQGLQYAAREYVGLLESHGVALSMTLHGYPYENAVAERVNGILKDEFGLGTKLPGFAQADALVTRAVALAVIGKHFAHGYLSGRLGCRCLTVAIPSVVRGRGPAHHLTELAHGNLGGPLGDVLVGGYRVVWPKMTKAFLNVESLLGPFEAGV
jgi:transposase InsO family protein